MVACGETPPVLVTLSGAFRGGVWPEGGGPEGYVEVRLGENVSVGGGWLLSGRDAVVGVLLLRHYPGRRPAVRFVRAPCCTKGAH